MKLFRKIYQNNFSEADWFFYIPQDVFVILENARLALAKKDPETPYLIGSINHGEKLAFLAISGGFIMSRTALKNVVNGLNQGKWETKIKGNKDIEFSKYSVICKYNTHQSYYYCLTKGLLRGISEPCLFSGVGEIFSYSV